MYAGALRAVAVWSVCVLMVCLVGQPSAAQADDATVVERLSVVQAETILKDFELEFEEVGNGAYKFRVDGILMVLFNMGDSLQMYAGFKDVRVTLSRINEWNKQKRYTRAYIDDDNDPVLESDLELTGGVTIGNVKEWMKTFVSALKLYKEHIEK